MLEDEMSGRGLVFTSAPGSRAPATRRFRANGNKAGIPLHRVLNDIDSAARNSPMPDLPAKPPETPETPPQSEPALRAVAMPADTNPHGDIFGGWLLCQMDLAGTIVATRRASGRVVTVAITAMNFHRPVIVGDEVTCYCEIEKIGNTSITVKIESWVRRGLGDTPDQGDGRHLHLRPRRTPMDARSRIAARQATG